MPATAECGHPAECRCQSKWVQSPRAGSVSGVLSAVPATSAPLCGCRGDDIDFRALLSSLDTPQTVHITQEEVEARCSREKVYDFWTDLTFHGWRFRFPPPISSLVVAAELDSIPIFDRLLAAGADASFWMADPPLMEIPHPPTPSSLSLGTPLHAAIRTRNIAMLAHLLELGFNPNVQPLAEVQASITPLMATFLDCEPWNQEAYNLLAQDPRIDFSVRTPYMLVHILHIAAAYSLEALQRVEQDTPLESAGAMAYGHTLLHIACFPTLHQSYSLKIRQSIHNSRFRRPRYRTSEGTRLVSAQGETPADYTKDFESQTELVKYLLESGTQSLTAFDSDLNTPLHYLAGARVVNVDLINFLRELPDGEHAWSEMPNWYGYTAKELFEDGERVRERKDPWFKKASDEKITAQRNIEMETAEMQ
ncbi:hypothetical protein VTN77DRAFT_1091 [Rasamsonia byssochlamydoides]|uniref:uncharacterized protein n=1 Tax=Rasamsonia byssochlamydoides TaxID=89139 RepID=UPI0037430F89